MSTSITEPDTSAPAVVEPPAPEPEASVWVPSPTNVAAHAAAEPTPVPEDAPVSDSTPKEPTGFDPDPPRTEAERLDPPPTGPVVLSTGTEVEIKPLNLREAMALLRIVTHGASGFLGPMVADLDFDDAQAFAQTLGVLLLMAIPDATQEAVDFVRGMCDPAGIGHLPAKDRVQHEQVLREELDNPPLEDVVTILERVIAREAEDIRGLGKRLGTAFKMVRRVERPQSAQS